MLDGDQLAARARTGAVPFDLARDALRRLTEPSARCCSAGLARRTVARPLPKTADRPTLIIIDFPLAGALVRSRLLRPRQQRQVLRLRPGGADRADRRARWTGSPRTIWVIVRQDLDYLKPLDFRLSPYEVATLVTADRHPVVHPGGRDP